MAGYSRIKKEKAEVLLCLFESKQHKDKQVFFLFDKETRS
jgi:hypothetical protein